MKRATLIHALTAVALVLGPAMTPDAAMLKNDPKGFNGYEWGKPPSAYPGLKLIQQLGATEVFKKLEVFQNGSDPLSLNGVTFTADRYRFADDQLESIELRFAGKEDLAKLMQWLEDRYGKLEAHEHRWRTIQWVGDVTSITLTFDRNTKQGYLWFFSRYLNNLVNEHTSMTD